MRRFGMVHRTSGMHKFQFSGMIYINAARAWLWYKYGMQGRHILYILITSGALIGLAGLFGGS